MSLSNGQQLDVQHQWDALFKGMVPLSAAIRRIVTRAYGLGEGSFAFSRERLPTDIPSTVVSDALHWRDVYKELRADGMFLLHQSKSVASFEYQTTHNTGMRLRFAMYMEALNENTENRLVGWAWYNILVYHGKRNRTFYQRAHGTVSRGYVNFLTIDLESIDQTEFEGGTIQDAILRLARRDTKRIKLFEDALARIRREVSHADRAAKLKKAVFVASLNKPRLRMEVWKMIDRDEVFMQEVEGFIPFFDELRAGHYKSRLMSMQRRGLADLVRLAKGPEYLLRFIEEASDEAIELYDGEIRTSAFSGKLAMLSDKLSLEYKFDDGPSLG